MRRSLGYVVTHHEHEISPIYDTREEAEMYRIFNTPGTDQYVVEAVYQSRVFGGMGGPQEGHAVLSD